MNEWPDSRRKYSANKSQMVRKTDDTEDNKTTEKQRKYATLTLKNNTSNLQVYSNLQHQCLKQNLTDNAE